MKRREFFRFVGGAASAAVAFAAGISILAPLGRFVSWRRFENVEVLDTEFGTIEGVRMLTDISRRRNCLNGTGYIDYGDPLRFHPCRDG